MQFRDHIFALLNRAKSMLLGRQDNRMPLNINHLNMCMICSMMLKVYPSKQNNRSSLSLYTLLQCYLLLGIYDSIFKGIFQIASSLYALSYRNCKRFLSRQPGIVSQKLNLHIIANFSGKCTLHANSLSEMNQGPPLSASLHLIDHIQCCVQLD